MKFKKFLLGLIFTADQKQLIWQAIQFSNYTFGKRHDVDNFEKTSELVKKTEPLFKEENA